jgi:hypothetical protein
MPVPAEDRTVKLAWLLRGHAAAEQPKANLRLPHRKRRALSAQLPREQAVQA